MALKISEPTVSPVEIATASQKDGGALDLGEASPAAPVVKAFRDLDLTLSWVQNPR